MLALPKSMHRKPRGRTDTSALLLPKVHPLRDEKYRRYVRDVGTCWLLNFTQPCGRHPERQPIECAHLPFSGVRGTSEKVSDAACAPLCPVHHDMLDVDTLPFQIVAFLWMKALFLREQWWREQTRIA